MLKKKSFFQLKIENFSIAYNSLLSNCKISLYAISSFFIKYFDMAHNLGINVSIFQYFKKKYIAQNGFYNGSMKIISLK